MNARDFNRLHALRCENDAAGYAMEELRPRFTALAQRHEAGTAPRAVSAFNLFQTPPVIAEQLAGIMDLREGMRILEPSAGLGRLLDAVKPFNPGSLVAVEVAAQCAGELFKREDCLLLQRDFLTVEPSHIGMFDAVIMNPPFHMRADIRHIEHARKFVNPGGVIGAICMHTEHRVKAFRDSAETWTVLPAGVFKSEGTRVESVIFTMR